MSHRRGVFLTGATGQVGQYLLRDLLLREYPVTVLVRDSRQESAAERIARIVDFWSERLGQTLSTPVVLCGDLNQPALGMTSSDRQWLGQHCQTMIHSAANLSFRETPAGEPGRTNVDGTKVLLDLCRNAGLSEWHQVSTAFVCGQRTHLIAEDDIEVTSSFHNAYEESKFQAEQLIRRAGGIQATIYRPSIIIGDSRTGYTSTYTGLYRFLELAVLFASTDSDAEDGALPLRLPLNGDEPWNLVPVDWVSQSIVELMGKPQWHGRTFHLVSRLPLSTRSIRDIGVKELSLRNIEFAGSTNVTVPTRREQLFNDGIREYWPYLGGNPIFSDLNTKEALPDLPPPIVDRVMLERLIRYAVANSWGRSRIPSLTLNKYPQSAGHSFCAEYLEQTFPRQARQSTLAREARLDLTICFDVVGHSGGQWSCQWIRGELVSVKRGLDERAVVTYHTDAVTFESVVNGSRTPQEAFFEQQINITGDVESALKLAVLFGQFLTEEQVSQHSLTDVINASTPT